MGADPSFLSTPSAALALAGPLATSTATLGKQGSSDRPGLSLPTLSAGQCRQQQTQPGAREAEPWPPPAQRFHLPEPPCSHL